MKIALCGSLSFAKEMGDLKNRLEEFGHAVRIPYSAERILSGEFSHDEIEKSKDQGSFHEMVIRNDAIRRWHEVIKESDGILVLNLDKKGIKNYIGGNSFLEIGFAHVLDKKIYLLNDIPDVSYKDEIFSMQPIILNGDLSRIA